MSFTQPVTLPVDMSVPRVGLGGGGYVESRCIAEAHVTECPNVLGSDHCHTTGIHPAWMHFIQQMPISLCRPLKGHVPFLRYPPTCTWALRK